MTPSDEIVCETEAQFRQAAWTHLVANVADYGPDIRPGDSVTIGGKTVRYTPKPAPPIGCLRDEHIDALKRDGRFVLNGETILYEATPRDEELEAFEKWAKSVGHLSIGRADAAWWTAYDLCARLTRDVAYEVFLAGRASVKP